MQKRAWQTECSIVLHGAFKARRDALVAATPGAGKTILALNFAGELKQADLVDHIHVTSPTLLISKNWRDVAAGLGLPLGSGSNADLSALGGISTTYAQVDKSPGTHAAIIDARRSIAICDELHHAGDDYAWGQSLKTALDHARFRLHLSGTPFRQDQHKIPFIEYGEDGVSRADYTYGYARAVTEGVCRPVSFQPYNAAIRFKGAASSDEMARVLRLSLMPKAGVIEKMVRDADSELTEKRKTWPDAAGLLVAMTQEHARACAAIIKMVTGVSPTVIVSDSETAEDDLIRFRSGTTRWVVAVKMLSEGVDVPRLMVAVYATNTSTTLFFRQLVGRVVRVRHGAAEETATIYMPRDDRLIAEAADIEAEVRQAIAVSPGRFEGLRQQLATGTTLRTSAESFRPLSGPDDHQFTFTKRLVPTSRWQ